MQRIDAKISQQALFGEKQADINISIKYQKKSQVTSNRQI